MMGQMQCLSQWLWMIVNKVKLITDGCQLCSPILPGAGRSHFRSFSKAVALASSSHVDFPFPGLSYCDNPQSALFCFQCQY